MIADDFDPDMDDVEQILFDENPNGKTHLHQNDQVTVCKHQRRATKHFTPIFTSFFKFQVERGNMQGLAMTKHIDIDKLIDHFCVEE